MLAARFPDTFRTEREKLGLSVRESAQLPSVSKQTVYAWEHGLSLPGFRQLASIRDVFALDRLPERAGALLAAELWARSRSPKVEEQRERTTIDSLKTRKSMPFAAT